MLTDRLWPLECEVSFESHLYRLGETINLTVELTPKRDTSIREGRVDLLCVEEHIDISAETVAQEPPEQRPMPLDVRENVGYLGNSPSAEMGKQSHQIVDRSENQYVHSSVVFLENADLTAGVKNTYDVRLVITPEPPHHYDQDTNITWKIATSIDVANARDVTEELPIEVALTAVN